MIRWTSFQEKSERSFVFFLTPLGQGRNELDRVFLVMSEIYFIRHAQASFGDEDYDHLSELGSRQAQILGDYFARIGLKFQAIYSGEMERQISTAQTAMSLLSEDDMECKLRVASEFNEYDSASIIKSQLPDMMHEDPSISEDLRRFFTHMRSFQRIFERAVLRWISGRCDIPGRNMASLYKKGSRGSEQGHGGEQAEKEDSSIYIRWPGICCYADGSGVV